MIVTIEELYRTLDVSNYYISIITSIYIILHNNVKFPTISNQYFL